MAEKFQQITKLSSPANDFHFIFKSLLAKRGAKTDIAVKTNKTHDFLKIEIDKEWERQADIAIGELKEFFHFGHKVTENIQLTLTIKEISNRKINDPIK